MGRFSEIIQGSDFSAQPDTSKNPDRFAADQDLAKQTGLPVDYVERNRDSAEQIKRQNIDYSQYADTELGGSLTDPEFSNLAQDDLDNLSYLERTGKELSNIGRLVPSAAYSITGAGYSILGSASNLISDAFTKAMSATGIEYKDDSLESDVFGYLGSGAMDIAKQHRAISQDYMPTDTVLPDPVVGGIKSAITNVPPLIAAVIAKNPNIALATMGGVTYGESNITGTEAGLSNLESAIYSANQTAAEVITERFPVGQLLKDVAQNSGFVKTVLAQMAMEIPTEQAATIWQDFNDWLVLSPDKTLADYAAERPQAAVDTLISTVVAVSLQTSAVSAVGAAANKLDKKQPLKEMKAVAEQSNLKRRSPEQFRQFLQAVDPLANIFIPASALEGVTITPDNPTLKLVADQLPQARALGGDIVVPVADVMTDIPQDVFDAVYPYMRVDADGVSEIEGRPDMKALIEEVNREADNQKQAKAFRDNLTGMLTGTARVTTDETKKYSAMVSARIETLAIDKGMTFDEAVQKYVGDLKVVGPDVAVGDGAIMDQLTPEETAFFESQGVLDGEPVAVESVQAQKDQAKAVVSELLSSGAITAEHSFRGATMGELRAIAETGELQVGRDAEGVPGISAAVIGDGKFPVYGEGVGIIVPPEAVTESGRAGEVLVDETTDPRTLQYVVDGKILSFDELKGVRQYAQSSALFPESNRLSNIDKSGAMWSAIASENPAIKKTADSDAEVTVYRATVGDSIRPNDFVALNKDISEMHMESLSDRGEAGKIIEMRVKLRDLLMANDATEFVYSPEQKQYTQAQYNESQRGLISITDKEIVIKLTEASNHSTFLHEAGHLFLEIESRIARLDGVSESQQKMLHWLGVKSFEEIGVEQHEKFARGFEAYAMEGRAPSADLVEVFRSFARWLKKVYSSMKSLNVELNDDIRQFFDRMLAADQAIKDAERLNQYSALFKDAKTAGMTEAEYADYQAHLARANSRGNETLQSKLLKELTRQTEKWWKESLSAERDKATETLGEQPIYRATRFLSGDMLDDPRYGGFDKYKMDVAATKAILGDGVRIPEQLRGMTEKGGLHPDEVAALFDFASGQDMIQQITSAPTLKQAAATAAQAAMVEQHGDILNDGTLQQEADISAHNEERGKLILSELRALNRKTGADTINRDALKFSAREIIGRSALKDIHPGKYRTAEVRAAREAATALAKKNYKAAAAAKLKQAANFYLYREAMDAKRKEQSWRRYLKSVQDRKYSAKEVNPDYVRQMKMLAAVYDFRKSGNASELLGVAQWLKAQQEVKDADYAPQILDTNLSAALEAAAKGDPVTVKHYREMTMDELQGVYDMVKHLRWVGGQMSENEKAKFQAECQATAENIAKFGGKIKEVPREETKRHRALSGLRQFLQDHLALANQIEQLDGFEKFGPMFEMVYKGIIDSSNTELKFRRETAEKMRSIFEGFGHSDFAEGKDERTIKTEAGNDFTLSRRGRVMFALYWGSPESREALMTGDNLTVNDANKMLSFLTGKELDLVEKIWELNESFWPSLAEVSRKMTGIVPAKVEHVPYAVGQRVMKGGYMRLYYDYDQRDSWQAVGAEDAKITRSGARLVTQTKHGSRNERVGSGGRKVSMSVNNIFRAMDEVIHDISFAETARKVTRVMANKDVSGAIINHYGKEKYESINSSLEGIIAGNVSNSHPINAFIRHFRTAATYSMLGYSLRNLIQQPVAVTNMFGKIGEVPVIAAMGDFVMNRNKWGKFVQDRSEFMRNRTSLVNREVAEIMASVGGNVMSNKLKQHAFDMQTMGDAMIAYPGWLAAYRQGLKQYGDESKAVAFADEAISATIGSGLMKDMSPLLQGSGRLAQTVGPEMLKTITFMGSYFNVVGRLIRDANKKADFRTVKGVAEYTRQMTWYLAAPAMLSAFLVGQGPDDDENWLAWAMKTVGSYGMASVFMMRDLVSVFSGYSPSTSYTRALESIGRAGKTITGIAEGEKDITDAEEFAKALRATSYLYPLPGAGQAARTIEYIGSQESGNEGDFNIYKAIVVGKDRD